ncbi:MAG: hypothetical protein JRJ00_13660, partial [Deltaproteobacteria bacterium]|nr:hypothetical protein [Deltaproteobacteria bacterium]
MVTNPYVIWRYTNDGIMLRRFVMVGLVFLVLILISGSQGETIIVDDDDGSWADYTGIQDDVNHSLDNDTIRVFAGTYYENVTVNRSVSLIGN